MLFDFISEFQFVIITCSNVHSTLFEQERNAVLIESEIGT